ncbi:MAG TPA: hypothetical protein VJ842_20140 [Pyrinomonadaceae bacterium]|nr:hypothetical protein [Pyrinomonadaceae bacterium]
MIETTNRTGTRPAAYYRAYYRALVEEHAGRSSSNNGQLGGLDSIKMRRRRARRGKWLQGMRSLVVGVLNKSEALN